MNRSFLKNMNRSILPYEAPATYASHCPSLAYHTTLTHARTHTGAGVEAAAWRQRCESRKCMCMCMCVCVCVCVCACVCVVCVWGVYVCVDTAAGTHEVGRSFFSCWQFFSMSNYTAASTHEVWTAGGWSATLEHSPCCSGARERLTSFAGVS